MRKFNLIRLSVPAVLIVGALGLLSATGAADASGGAVDATSPSSESWTFTKRSPLYPDSLHVAELILAANGARR